jgi:hypothetical protein
MSGDQEYIERRFLFQGSALGLAAHIRRPKDELLESVASSVLAITGGLAQAQAGPGKTGIISYDGASTQASGDFVPSENAVQFTHGNYADNNLNTQTVVQTNLSGLVIDVPQEHSGLHFFGKSNRVVSMAQLTAVMGNTSDRQTPNAFRTLNVTIDGVLVDGKTLIVETNTNLFTDKCTKRELDCALDDDDFRQTCSNQILRQWPGMILATVVKRMYWADGAPPETKIENNQLIVNGIGSLYFGELIIQEGLRRIALVRFQLGSPHGGEGTGGQVGASGGTMPPQLSGP